MGLRPDPAGSQALMLNLLPWSGFAHGNLLQRSVLSPLNMLKKYFLDSCVEGWEGYRELLCFCPFAAGCHWKSCRIRSAMASLCYGVCSVRGAFSHCWGWCILQYCLFLVAAWGEMFPSIVIGANLMWQLASWTSWYWSIDVTMVLCQLHVKSMEILGCYWQGITRKGLGDDWCHGICAPSVCPIRSYLWNHEITYWSGSPLCSSAYFFLNWHLLG